MKEVYVIVKKGYSSILSSNRVFESKDHAQKFLDTYCNKTIFEVISLKFVPAVKPVVEPKVRLVVITEEQLLQLI